MGLGGRRWTSKWWYSLLSEQERALLEAARLEESSCAQTVGELESVAREHEAAGRFDVASAALADVAKAQDCLQQAALRCRQHATAAVNAQAQLVETEAAMHIYTDLSGKLDAGIQDLMDALEVRKLALEWQQAAAAARCAAVTERSAKTELLETATALHERAAALQLEANSLEELHDWQGGSGLREQAGATFQTAAAAAYDADAAEVRSLSAARAVQQLLACPDVRDTTAVCCC